MVVGKNPSVEEMIKFLVQREGTKTDTEIQAQAKEIYKLLQYMRLEEPSSQGREIAIAGVQSNPKRVKALHGLCEKLVDQRDIGALQNAIMNAVYVGMEGGNVVGIKMRDKFCGPLSGKDLVELIGGDFFENHREQFASMELVGCTCDLVVTEKGVLVLGFTIIDYVAGKEDVGMINVGNIENNRVILNENAKEYIDAIVPRGVSYDSVFGS